MRAFFAALVSLGVGCSSSTSTQPSADAAAEASSLGDAGTPDSDTADARRHPVLDQQCEASTDPDACKRCSAEHCCETKAACDTACQATFSCVNGCSGDVACIDKCIVDGKAGAATYSAQNACVNLYCTSQCSGAVDACRECRLKNCALEHVTCFADPDCRRYGYCFEACTTSECDAACRARFSAPTVATYDGYLACLKSKCEADCL